MRLKIVDYWGGREFAERYEFECITDSHDDFVSVSAFALCDAAGLPKTFTTEQARDLIGKEFNVPWGLIPASYICHHTPTIATDGDRWRDLGEFRCEMCGRRYCACGDRSQPVAA